MADIVARYDQYFAVVRARTPEQLDLAYRLRYQVYCVEHRFEDPRWHRDRREADEDDDRSAHALLLHRPSGAAAGTVRLIMPALGERPRPLPIEQALDPVARARLGALAPQQIAEVSRFAVSKSFRRRHRDGRYGEADDVHRDDAAATVDRRVMPFITLGLLRAVLGICLEHRVSHLAAMMEPALLRLLLRLGLVFEPLGGLVEHHGLRQPCLARLDDLTRRSRQAADLLWHYAGRDLVEIEAVGRAATDPGWLHRA
ncbi:MAG TPA: PEP-CTERM/exosortase system-associated acyltransferase [Stellaceae bacterium]|nr:PEP-CTERM/exosortase system-associated acyltransferase [Stellaceae bacterium]